MHKGETRGSRPIQSMAKYFRFCWQFMGCHQHTQEYHQNILRDLYRQFMACHQHTQKRHQNVLRDLSRNVVMVLQPHNSKFTIELLQDLTKQYFKHKQ